jgi:signal transduction histidine kinase
VAPGPYVMLSLADAGTGMMSEVLARAMEPFFTTKDVGLGSGLGLSMVFGFVKQSHGHLAIESVPGAGTTVRLYLPRADVAAAPVARAGEAVS